MKKIEELLERAKKIDSKARLITQRRGGYRKAHPMGSTYSPLRVIMIDGKSFSHPGAKLYLRARELRISLNGTGAGPRRNT